MTSTRFMNPETIAKPGGYSHVVETVGPGRIVYIAGQLGVMRAIYIAHSTRAELLEYFIVAQFLPNHTTTISVNGYPCSSVGGDRR